MDNINIGNNAKAVVIIGKDLNIGIPSLIKGTDKNASNMVL